MVLTITALVCIKIKLIFCLNLGEGNTFGFVSDTPILLQALCPLRDVPSQSNHGDPLSYYQTGDLIRGK